MAFAPASLKRNVLVSWGAHGLAIVIGFFLMPYVVRVMGDRTYGTWVFINSIASYGGLLYFGFGETISRYVAKYQAERKYERISQIVTLILAIYLVMGAVAIAIAGGLCAAAPYISSWQGAELTEVRWTILVLGLNVAVGMSGSVFGGVLMGLRRFDLERTVSLSSDLMKLALVFLFLRQEWGLVTMACIFLAITVVENVAYLVLACRQLPQLRIRWSLLSREVFHECSSFSSMAFLNAIAYQMTNATDTVVIGLMMGTDEIVPYYIALRLSQFIKQPIDKIAQICMPAAGALSNPSERHRLHRFLIKAYGLVFLLTSGMFLGGWFFGGGVIAAWMGDGYALSHHILAILLAAQVIALPCSVIRAFLFGMGEVRVPAFLYLLEAVCNLTASIVLCHFWGLPGVAWGTLIPVAVVELGLTLPLGLKLVGLPVRRLWREAIAPQLLPIAALAAYSWIVAGQIAHVDGWPILIAVTFGGGAVLGSMWWLAGRLLRAPATT
ncbi:MAG: oligosaccharide flippase family protein [Planctomycetaceae bacterium]|nr:oligosaccharide flippase family protein [Planctomycetaceae bacterium]